MSNIKGGTTRFGSATLVNYNLQRCKHCREGIVSSPNGKYCKECKVIVKKEKRHRRYLEWKAQQQAKDNS